MKLLFICILFCFNRYIYFLFVLNFKFIYNENLGIVKKKGGGGVYIGGIM